MIAWGAILSWPLLAIWFYRVMSLPVALCVTLIGGYLLLPWSVKYDPPMIPALDRESIPVITAIILTALAIASPRNSAKVLKGWLPRDTVSCSLLALFVAGIVLSVLTNQDRLYYGLREIRGMSLYDAGSILLEFALIIAPFFLARRVLATPEGHRIVLLALAVSGVIYTAPALFEVRMSPQLHAIFYGSFPSSFAQHMRGGGFRPVVFLNHGLALGIYFTFALLAAAALMRMADKSSRSKWGAALGLLFVTMVLSKVLGPMLIALVLLPMVLFLKPRTQMLAAVCILIGFLTYPVLRSADLVPVNTLLNLAEQVNPERSQSLNTRLVNEENLLNKAMERPVFGWGGWGRNRIYNAYGRDISITDGQWVIVLGVGGWVQYIALFGLLAWPVMGLFIRHRDKVGTATAALALILCAKLVDMLPNSGWIPVIFITAGALQGRLEMLSGVGERSPMRMRNAPGPDPGTSGSDDPAPDPGTPPNKPQYARTFARKDAPRSPAPVRPAAPRATRTGPARAAVKPGRGIRR